MIHKIARVSVPKYPLVEVQFTDGFSGVIDLSPLIRQGTVFERLMDKAYFQTVAVSEHGHAFGWNLSELGREIDFSADGARADIETAKVKQMAETHRLSSPAAE